MSVVRELSSADLTGLQEFYRVYRHEFPDRNERESLRNMRDCLQHRYGHGADRHDNYHILVIYRGGQPIGGAVANYFAGPRAGVIEFLFVATEFQGEGHGRRLREAVERKLRADARQQGGRLRGIFAEMNDPFLSGRVRDSMDPFQRAEIWGHWGFCKLQMAYSQPALAKGKYAVHHLALIIRPQRPRVQSVPCGWVLETLHEYMRLAMRIGRPAKTRELRRMSQELQESHRVALIPLRAYVGRDPPGPLTIEETRPGQMKQLRKTSAFLAREYGIDQSGPRHTLPNETAASHYHLWTLRKSRSKKAAGIASFFSFRDYGLGGCLLLGQSLRGRGYFRTLLARIEEQLVRDSPKTRGWFVECCEAASPVFLRCGFQLIPVTYHAPSQQGQQDARRLTLLYKPLGSERRLVELTDSFLLNAFENVLRHIYSEHHPRTTLQYCSFQESLRRIATSKRGRKKHH